MAPDDQLVPHLPTYRQQAKRGIGITRPSDVIRIALFVLLLLVLAGCAGNTEGACKFGESQCIYSTQSWCREQKGSFTPYVPCGGD
jgi:hypothetical protein